MADDNSQLLSQSLATNMDQSQMRDPFVQAQQQYQDRMGSPQVLSSSPMQSSVKPMTTQASMPNNNPSATATQPQGSMLYNPSTQQDFTKFNASPIPKAMQQLGVDSKGLSLNDLGKTQLVGRLKQKFGASYSDSPQVMQLLGLFDKHASMGQPTDNKASVSAGQRTLAALLGGG
jgi:hypothetical protein